MTRLDAILLLAVIFGVLAVIGVILSWGIGEEEDQRLASLARQAREQEGW